MQKFRFIYNADGSFSRFRALCLLIVALCMVALAVLRQERPQAPADTDDTALPAESSAAGTALNAVFDDGQDEAQRQLLKRRALALSELNDGARFLSTCGNINAGFEGCRFEFSPEVLRFYDAQVEAADDGFSIVLKAKGEQSADLCAEIGISSGGQAYALDKDRHEQRSCLTEELRKPDLSAVQRRTDFIMPATAPSGRQPIVTRTAQSVRTEGQISL